MTFAVMLGRTARYMEKIDKTKDEKDERSEMKDDKDQSFIDTCS